MNRTLAKRLLLGIFAFEVIVPALMLVTTEEPRHYAWSMYAKSLTIYRYIGLTHDNQKVVLDPAELGSPWSAIHYGPETLQLLCERHPELGSITRHYDGEIERSEPC